MALSTSVQLKLLSYLWDFNTKCSQSEVKGNPMQQAACPEH